LFTDGVGVPVEKAMEDSGEPGKTNEYPGLIVDTVVGCTVEYVGWPVTVTDTTYPAVMEVAVFEGFADAGLSRIPSTGTCRSRGTGSCAGDATAGTAVPAPTARTANNAPTSAPERRNTSPT
jgi:hypothetical protein